MELRGAVVVVTGASSGLGEATAVRFARAGAHVVLAARRFERLEAVAEHIRAGGGTALPIGCDVTVKGDVAALAERTLEAFGRCDVLVNDAGIPGGGWFRELTVERIEQVVRVNLLGTMLVTKAFLPAMLDRRRGHVVNVASLAGRFASPGIAVYGATKHGVVAFSESLHYELGPFGILVTAVNPGFVSTEGFPQDDVPRPLLMPADRIARAVEDVVRRGRVPEVSVPRWPAAFQAFRVLTPPLYRWGVRRVTGRRWRRGAAAEGAPDQRSS
jgi:NAD(P)-dependent dehydrogenase (short-subunit alcohol dehydrogenase family)